ncbi:unnamed protein product [marine sediment metagenome]|uniref:Ribbon-helix-helix protein CopG domain-containing protein n=1 Tax=marine sediment metagenome TaxID=412755 RepID=X1S646_9ZZZZ
MSIEKRMPEPELRRNCLSVRLKDREMREFADYCWAIRKSVSSTARQILVDALRERGGKV